MTLRQTKNNLSEKIRGEAVEFLLPCLASTVDLYLQAKTSHWNVRGPRFFFLHELFDKTAESLLEPIDILAERIAQLGGVASSATAQSLSSNTTLAPIATGAMAEQYYIEHLVSALGVLGARVRLGIDDMGRIGDADTADILTALSRDLDKSLWFIESHLE